jgi:N-acetylmuramoyl-L-alanine amidase
LVFGFWFFVSVRSSRTKNQKTRTENQKPRTKNQKPKTDSIQYDRVVLSRPFCSAAATLLLALLHSASAAQPPAGASAPYTVISREGRRPLATRTMAGQEMFALDDLARLFSVIVREDAAAGGLTVTAGTATIALSPGQSLASLNGRLISLPAPPVRDGRSWYVPVDFVSRALAPALAGRIDLRKPSRLIIVGDIRAPRIVGRMEALGSLARLTLDIAPATPHNVVQEGTKLTVRFEADMLDAALPATMAPDLVANVRPGEGSASIAIDLGPRFASFRTTDTPGDRGAARLVIDVMAQTTEAQPTPTPSPPAPEIPPLIDLAPSGGLRAIVIDAGHGGEENGAKGPAGALEKHITLSVARRLKAALEGRLGVRVILTRDSDATVGLDERAAIANNNKADLFVSLHANAAPRTATSGAEVFYLSLDEYGDAAERVAHTDSDPLPVFGGGTRDIELILWDMAQARYIKESAALAQTVEASLRQRVPMSAHAIQQAPFRVLVGANMPAILVEMGFITNAAQEKQLQSDDFQNLIVQALVESITRFRDTHGGSNAAGSR